MLTFSSTLTMKRDLWWAKIWLLWNSYLKGHNWPTGPICKNQNYRNRQNSGYAWVFAGSNSGKAEVGQTGNDSVNTLTPWHTKHPPSDSLLKNKSNTCTVEAWYWTAFRTSKIGQIGKVQSSPDDRQKGMHMSAPCTLHRWAESIGHAVCHMTLAYLMNGLINSKY